MKIIIRASCGGYTFSITENRKTLFSSSKEFFLTNFVKSIYKYAWRACRDGRRLIHNSSYHLTALKNRKYGGEDLTKPIAVEISAEDMLIDHYYELLDGRNFV